jgi:hypothetical protein
MCVSDSLKATSDPDFTGIHVSAAASPGSLFSRHRGSELVINLVEDFAVTREKDASSSGARRIVTWVTPECAVHHRTLVSAFGEYLRKRTVLRFTGHNFPPFRGKAGLREDNKTR